MAAACCCVQVMARDKAVEAMLGPTTEPSGPSLFSRLCWCQSSPKGRQAVDAEDWPEVSNLASGVLLQNGSHTTAGSLHTFKWGKWDKATRSFIIDVFGGINMPQTTGTWTEPAGSCLWMFFMFLARTASYRYDVTFSEDYQRADIKVRGNLCCCVPCLPVWFTCPGWVTTQYMIQSEGSIKGDKWDRYSGNCCKEPKYYYDLVVAYDGSGTPTRFGDLVPDVAPAQVMMTF
jgi:hypothetical protein